MTLPTITLGGNVDIIGDLICTDCVDHTDILQIGSQDTIGKSSTNGGAECYIGEIRLFSNNIIPRGFYSAEGQTLPIAQHNSLFSVIGTKYGGDGISTFGLPDLRNVEPTHRTPEGVEVDVNYAICVVGILFYRPYGGDYRLKEINPQGRVKARLYGKVLSERDQPTLPTEANEPVLVPENLEVDDIVIFSGTGAYTGELFTHVCSSYTPSTYVFDGI